MIARPRRFPALLVFLALVGQACKALPDLEKEQAKAAPLAQTSFLYDADGRVITAFHAEQNREVVPYKKIPQEVRDAVVAIEDRRFYDHRGIDLKAVMRATYQNAQAGAIVQGGSTITEQYVKNAYLDPERTLSRKFNEAALAWQLEQEFSKEQILARYLNTVYLGEGAYGIKAAAETYFSKQPRQLNLQEAALIAGLIRAPSDYSPLNHRKRARQRRNVVLGTMLDLDYIDQKEFQRASEATMALHPDRREEQYEAPYFVDYVKRWFLNNDRFGKTYEDRYDLLFNGGLRIHTTLDPQIQRVAEQSVDRILSNRSDPYGALTALDPNTGEIKAMVGGRGWFLRNDKLAKVNLATGGSTGRQAGSSFKPFTLVAALESGLKPSKTYSGASPITIRQGKYSKPWHVVNAEGGQYGRLTIEQATINSVNTVYAQIIMDVGPEKSVKVAEEMGIRCCTIASAPDTPLLAVPSAVLGSNEVNTLEMASAIGTLATGGAHVNPVAIRNIEDSEGRPIFSADADSKQVVDPKIAYRARTILEKVVSQGTGTAAALSNVQEFGKTGTAQNYSDAWFIGSTPNLTAAVWVGYPTKQKSMCCTRIGTVYGGTWPAQIWHSFMSRAASKKGKFPGPHVRYVHVKVDETRGCLPNKYTPPTVIDRDSFVSGTQPSRVCAQPTIYESFEIPSVIGLPKGQATTDLKDAGFTEVKLEEKKADDPKNTVIAQEPAAGEESPWNNTVKLTVASA
ncbi:MAG: PBP1A family penicillin-binding protein [Actinomycetota bacterium]